MFRSKEYALAIWARRHVLALALLDNALTALAVAGLGFWLGLVIGVVLTVATYEIEHYRRTIRVSYKIVGAELDQNIKRLQAELERLENNGR